MPPPSPNAQKIHANHSQFALGHLLKLRLHRKFIPIESLIKDHQQDYYQALEKSDRAGDSTHFVEFFLEMIHCALEDFLQNFSPKPLTAAERLTRAAQESPQRKFSRKDYLALFKIISTASRDLKQAFDSALLQKQGEKAQTVYVFQNS